MRGSFSAARVGVVAIATFLSSLTVHAASVIISYRSVQAPASDLLFQGKAIDSDQAVQLQRSGVDLSRLDPEGNDVWTLGALPISNSAQYQFPGTDSAGKIPEGQIPEVIFKETMPSIAANYWARVLDQPGAKGRVFRLVAALDIHTTLLRTALLRKLGYYRPTPQYYPQLKVSFDSIETRDAFVLSLMSKTGTPAERWVVSQPKDIPMVILQDVNLETGHDEVTDITSPKITPSHIQGQRAVRAAIVLLALTDLGESINMFSWDFGRSLDDSMVLTAPSAAAFQETTIDDVKWIARRLALIDRSAFQKILAQSYFPEDIQAILLEKLVARRNQLLKLAKVSGEFSADWRDLPYNTRLNIGTIQKGKLTQEFFPGYAAQFTWGDPKSPLRSSELARYLEIEGISYGLGRLTRVVNEKLQALTVENAAKKYQDELKKKIVSHLMAHPDQPYTQPVAIWGGPIAGVNTQVGRHVVTGTYYGADSRVQLVDSLSVSGTVGLFLGVDGLAKIIPSASGNLSLQRTYVHVRPVNDVKSALKTNWDRILVPNFMKNLGGILDDSDLENTSSSDRISKFLAELQEGEIFTISDSLALSGNVQVNIPVTALLGLDPVGFQNGLTLGGGTRGVVMSRTTFLKTKTGIQVYLQRMKTEAVSFSFDFNYWMKIFHYGGTSKKGNAQTKAYILPIGDSSGEKTNIQLAALRTLFMYNNTELLEKNFEPYQLDHELEARMNDGQFLWWKWNSIEEIHRLRVRPPADPEHGIKPEEHERQFFLNRIGEKAGHDYVTFLSDVVDGFWSDTGFSTESSGNNPAFSFFGKGVWESISTEGETTLGSQPDRVSIVEHHWGGWSLSKKDFLKILDRLEAKTRKMDLDVPLIDRNAFNDMKRLQMYDIQSSLFIYENGMSRIEAAMTTDLETPEVYKTLKNLKGAESVDRWCTHYSTDAGPGGNDERGLYREKKRRKFRKSGESNYYDMVCVQDWMASVFKERREFHKMNTEQRIVALNRITRLLEKNIPFENLLKWLGKDAYYYEVRISGFRTQDEAGDVEYVSNAIGTINSQSAGGAFRSLASKYDLMAHEVYAQYFSEGN